MEGLGRKRSVFLRARVWKRALGALAAASLGLWGLCLGARAQSAAAGAASGFSLSLSSAARLDAVFSAIRSGDPAAAPALESGFPAEPLPDIRAWIVRAASDLNAANGAVFFETALQDPSPWVRLAAVEALGKLGNAQARSDLTAVLASETNPGVRQSAAYWLGKIGGAPSVSALGQALASDDNPNVRAQAARSLAALATPAAQSALRLGRNDADERVRQIANGH